MLALVSVNIPSCVGRHCGVRRALPRLPYIPVICWSGWGPRLGLVLQIYRFWYMCELLHQLHLCECLCVQANVCLPSLCVCMWKVCVVPQIWHIQSSSPSDCLSVSSTLGEAWAQLKRSLADEAEVHMKFSSKVICFDNHMATTTTTTRGVLPLTHACFLFVLWRLYRSHVWLIKCFWS